LTPSRLSPPLSLATRCLWLLMAANACARPAPRPPTDDAGGTITVCPQGTAAIQHELLLPRCGIVGCHAAEASASGLDLVSPDLERRLANTPGLGCKGDAILVRGNPGRSLLFIKTAQANPKCGVQMPPLGKRASAVEVACIRSWITALADADGGAGDRL
jgi:hypothetical protein